MKRSDVWRVEKMGVMWVNGQGCHTYAGRTGVACLSHSLDELCGGLGPRQRKTK